MKREEEEVFTQTRSIDALVLVSDLSHIALIGPWGFMHDGVTLDT